MLVRPAAAELTIVSEVQERLRSALIAEMGGDLEPGSRAPQYEVRRRRDYPVKQDILYSRSVPVFVFLRRRLCEDCSSDSETVGMRPGGTVCIKPAHETW